MIPKQLSPDDARHLLRRTGFSPTEAQVQACEGQSAHAVVKRLIEQAKARTPQTPPPEFTQQAAPVVRPGQMSAEANQVFRREQAAQALQIKSWWLSEMISTSAPLAERMVLFWHNHFATSQQKVVRALPMWRQHQLLRQHALGNFRSLLHGVSKDPAMLVYLDGAQSRKGAPNENFAREVMELFTLGQASGAYTEQDIKEAARAFTGWSVDREDFSFRQRPAFQDEGLKTIFGQTAAFEGDAVLDMLLDASRVKGAASRFIVAKLWREFVSPQPDAAEVVRIGLAFERSGYDIAVALRELFLCPDFWNPQQRGSLIKSPVELIVGTVRQLGFESGEPTALVLKSAQLGQNLLLPPNVKGWPGYTDWINATTLLERKRFLEQLLRASSTGSAQAGMGMNAMRREFGERGAGSARRELGQLEQVMGEQGVQRVAQSMQSLSWDAERFLSGFGAHADREPSVAEKARLHAALLSLPPTQAIAAGTVGVSYVRALTQDAAYQVK